MTSIGASGTSVQIPQEYQGGKGRVGVGFQGARNTDGKTFLETAKDCFGEDLAVVSTYSNDLDAKHELAHTTTGLKYSLRGRARVIEQSVGRRLASFQDPIKAILPVTVVDAHRVIVTTKEIVGGRSIIAPERAPARTVGVKESSREVVLERYGGDLEMNLNLQHTPEAFKEELNLKIAAQLKELERVLIELGYETLMTQGLQLPDAIQRSNPAYHERMENSTRLAVRMEANRIYIQNCFASLSKNPFPLQSILCAAKYTTAYSIGAPGSVLILPHGVPEMLRYTKPERMKFNISGLKTTDNKPISMDLGDAHTDPATNIKMMVHVPMPTYEFGTGMPRVGMGCMSRIVTVISFYMVPSQIAQCTKRGEDGKFEHYPMLGRGTLAPTKNTKLPDKLTYDDHIAVNVAKADYLSSIDSYSRIDANRGSATTTQMVAQLTGYGLAAPVAQAYARSQSAYSAKNPVLLRKAAAELAAAYTRYSNIRGTAKTPSRICNDAFIRRRQTSILVTDTEPAFSRAMEDSGVTDCVKSSRERVTELFSTPESTHAVLTMDYDDSARRLFFSGGASSTPADRSPNVDDATTAGLLQLTASNLVSPLSLPTLFSSNIQTPIYNVPAEKADERADLSIVRSLSAKKRFHGTTLKNACSYSSATTTSPEGLGYIREGIDDLHGNASVGQRYISVTDDENYRTIAPGDRQQVPWMTTCATPAVTLKELEEDGEPHVFINLSQQVHDIQNQGVSLSKVSSLGDENPAEFDESTSTNAAAAKAEHLAMAYDLYQETMVASPDQATHIADLTLNKNKIMSGTADVESLLTQGANLKTEDCVHSTNVSPYLSEYDKTSAYKFAPYKVIKTGNYADSDQMNANISEKRLDHYGPQVKARLVQASMASRLYSDNANLAVNPYSDDYYNASSDIKKLSGTYVEKDNDGKFTSSYDANLTNPLNKYTEVTAKKLDKNADRYTEVVNCKTMSKERVYSNNGSAQLVFRKTRVMMSSAILAKPGAATGELLVGMPHTGVSTSQTDESLKMQLRVYLGAVLKQPESAIILPDVAAEGVVSQTSYPVGNKEDYAMSDGKGGCPWKEKGSPEAFTKWMESDEIDHDFIMAPESIVDMSPRVCRNPTSGSKLTQKTMKKWDKPTIKAIQRVHTVSAANGEETYGSFGNTEYLGDITGTDRKRIGQNANNVLLAQFNTGTTDEIYLPLKQRVIAKSAGGELTTAVESDGMALLCSSVLEKHSNTIINPPTDAALLFGLPIKGTRDSEIVVDNTLPFMSTVTRVESTEDNNQCWATRSANKTLRVEDAETERFGKNHPVMTINGRCEKFTDVSKVEEMSLMRLFKEQVSSITYMNQPIFRASQRVVLLDNDGYSSKDSVLTNSGHMGSLDDVTNPGKAAGLSGTFSYDHGSSKV